MTKTDLDYAAKFVRQLGDTSDFVDYVRHLEAAGRLEDLAVFKGTDGTWEGRRYLMLSAGGVIDFRHFFAAMMLRFTGANAQGLFGPGSVDEGTALMLGLGNELTQCLGEGLQSKLNSCFSREDLHSNRLGAEFGEAVVIARAEANRMKVANLLEAFLLARRPLSPQEVQRLRVQGSGGVALEALRAVVQGLGDLLIPKAY